MSEGLITSVLIVLIIPIHELLHIVGCKFFKVMMLISFGMSRVVSIQYC